MPDMDVEMSDSTSLEIQEIDMEDAGDDPLIHSGSSPEEMAENSTDDHVTENSHLTNLINGKDDGETGAGISNSSGPEVPASLSKQGTAKSEVVASVEQDEMDEVESPAIAEEPNSKASEGPKPALESSPRARQTISATPAKAVEQPTVSEQIKFDKDVKRFKQILSEVSPQAAQKVMRDQWRLFLFDNYNDDHVSFILRAGLKNSNPVVLERVLKDDTIFRETLLKVASKKPGFVERVLKGVAAKAIFANVPGRVQSEVVTQQIRAAPAKQLIRWLAEGDRLGYKMDDILDAEDETVTPNMAYRAHDSDVEILDVVERRPPHMQYASQPQPYALQYYAPHYGAPPPKPPPGYAVQYHAAPYAPQPYAPRPLANPNTDPLLLEQERNAASNIARAKQVQLSIAKNAASSLNGRPQSGVAKKDLARQMQQAQAQAPPPGPCPACGIRFETFSGYTYHVTKKVCAKDKPPGDWTCDNCMSHFTTKQGREYHIMRAVCTGPDIAPATPATAPVLPPPQTSSAPIIPLSRPPMHTQPAPLQQGPLVAHVAGAILPPQRPLMQTPFPPMAISRPLPPVMTPRKKLDKNEIRHSPSELPPEKLAQMNREIEEVDEKTEQNIAEIPATFTPEQRASRLQSLKNQNATRKSQIRKSHGVSLRMRQKDKKARIDAGIEPLPARLDEFRASTGAKGSPLGTPHDFPPTSSFSPVNTVRNAPPAASGHSANHYGEVSSSSGFGVLKNSKPINGTSANYQPGINYIPTSTPSSISNKRRRTSQEPTSSTYNHPPSSYAVTAPQNHGLAMQEVSAEDAAFRFAKPSSRTDMTMADASNSNRRGSRADAVNIDSDGDSDSSSNGDIPAQPQRTAEPVRPAGVLQSVETGDEDMGEGDGAGVGGDGVVREASREQRSLSRGKGFMVKRGGKH